MLGIKKVFDQVKMEYLKIIDEQSWMSDKTKRKAKTKVNKMKLNVGVLSPKTPTYVKLQQGIGKTDYFPNIFAIGNYRREAQVQSLGKELKEHRPVVIQDEESWNAYYRPTYNEFAILAGLINGFFGIGLQFDIPKALLYGGFRALGHEMMHAFDGIGRVFDEDGFRLDWWTKAENDVYERGSQCLVGNMYFFRISCSPVRLRLTSMPTSQSILTADCMGTMTQVSPQGKTLQTTEA